jgi:hypothetical protein
MNRETAMNDDEVTMGWKTLTHDWRSPLQGGEPVCTGTAWPVHLDGVVLDTTDRECGAGWNYTASIAGTLAIAGLWPMGRPSQIVRVVAGPDAVERGGKRRASTLTLERLATRAEIEGAVGSWFPVAHRAAMVDAQMAWRDALGRPRHDPATVQAGLVAALAARGLAAWTVRQIPDARDAGAAWAAWAAGAAGAALVIRYARVNGWIAGEPEQYTVGLLDAYRHGLALAIPTGPAELGWAMDGDRNA